MVWSHLENFKVILWLIPCEIVCSFLVFSFELRYSLKNFAKGSSCYQSGRKFRGDVWDQPPVAQSVNYYTNTHFWEALFRVIRVSAFGLNALLFNRSRKLWLFVVHSIRERTMIWWQFRALGNRVSCTHNTPIKGSLGQLPKGNNVSSSWKNVGLIVLGIYWAHSTCVCKPWMPGEVWWFVSNEN